MKHYEIKSKRKSFINQTEYETLKQVQIKYLQTLQNWWKIERQRGIEVCISIEWTHGQPYVDIGSRYHWNEAVDVYKRQVAML